MRLLGAILAGGHARRFGSDKAYALWAGERLIDRVAAALGPQCEALVVCGREEPGFTCLADRPGPDLGPLGGLNAALHHARDAGFDAVLASGCDIPNLPRDLVRQLQGDAPAFAQSQPVIGLWPASLADACETYLSGGGRALYGFAEAVGARPVTIHPPPANINRPQDLPDQ